MKYLVNKVSHIPKISKLDFNAVIVCFKILNFMYFKTIAD